MDTRVPVTIAANSIGNGKKHFLANAGWKKLQINSKKKQNVVCPTFTISLLKLDITMVTAEMIVAAWLKFGNSSKILLRD